MSEDEKATATDHLISDCRAARTECALLTNEVERLANTLERIALYLRDSPDSGITDRDIITMPKAEEILSKYRKRGAARSRKAELEARLGELGLSVQ